jgi:membrane-bound serine protease (ClpP class)
MRARPVPSTLAIASLLTGVLIALAAPVHAQPVAAPAATPTVAVIEVSGRIDPIVADFIHDSLGATERTGSEALVIQLDSPGDLVSDASLTTLTARLTRATVPVAVWVGESGARAYGGGARLADVAGIVGVAPGSHIGECPSCRVRPGLRTTRSLSSGQALARKAADLVSPTIGDFIVDLDGRTVNGHTLQTARVVQRNGQPRREPSVNVSFAKLTLLPRLLHTVASPSVAYLLLMAGMVLIVFEFFTVGIGLAGGAGAVFLVLAAYGLAVLPTRPLALGLLTVGMVGFGIDVQTGAPRVWTGIGALSLVAGTWILYDGVPLPLITAVLTLLGVALFMLAAMPSVVRARFSTPTIGRETMVGEVGSATAALNPEGMVRVRQALWQARTNRATPIAEGDPVRVIGVEGLVLQVEPVEPDERPDEGPARPAGA